MAKDLYYLSKFIGDKHSMMTVILKAFFGRDYLHTHTHTTIATRHRGSSQLSVAVYGQDGHEYTLLVKTKGGKIGLRAIGKH